MTEILTITFNPAIDKSTTVPQLIPEKKLKCSQPHFEPGGGGINVARVINRLGGAVAAIYPSGGHPGNFFNDLLLEEKIMIKPCLIRGNTRENMVIHDLHADTQYRFGMPGPTLSEEEWRSCIHAIQEYMQVKYIVVSGSLPSGIPFSVFNELKMIADSLHANLVIDTSGEPLMHAASCGAFLLKPNLGELAMLTGKDKIQENEIPAIGRELIIKKAAKMLLVSMGEQGAILITDQHAWRAKPPTLPRKSTVGAGDSMVAGFIYALCAGKTPESALAYAVAAGTATTQHPGTQLCGAGDPEKLLPSVCLSEVKC
jgi:6-phosphofructokinase 2